MAADELGGGMDYHVGAVLDGTEEVRGAKGVVDSQGQAVLVRDLRYCVHIRDVRVRVAQGLGKDQAGVVLNGALDGGQVVRVDKGGLDAKGGEGVLQQIGGSAVNALLSHHVLAGMNQGLDDIGNGGSTRGHCQTCDAALKSGDAVLKHALGGVGQTAVDVAGILEAKTVGSVLGAVKDVRGGLVDGHGAGVGGGVGALLSHMQSLGLEPGVGEVCHDKHVLS